MSPSRQRLLAAVAAAAAALSPMGCGKGQEKNAPSPQQEVRSTLDEFARAVARRDYQTVCTRLLAPSLTERMTQIGLPCVTGLAKGFGLARNPTLSVVSIKVSGSHATAVVRSAAANQAPSQDALALVRSAGGTWQISALGPGGPAVR